MDSLPHVSPSHRKQCLGGSGNPERGETALPPRRLPEAAGLRGQRKGRMSPGQDLVGAPQFWVLFLPSPEKPHLNLWLEAPDLLLAEIDLPRLVSAHLTRAGERSGRVRVSEGE